MPLFRYPKSKHVREQSPPDYEDYRKYKPFLQKEFNHTCIYCMLTDSLPKADNFGVEHYQPKKLFPQLSTIYSNLFYACNCCNRRKSDFWPSSHQFALGQFIPNPCDHVMFDHLRYDGHIVKGHSDSGRFAVDLLDLNDEKSLEYRSNVLVLLKSLNDSITRIKQTISKLEKRIAVTNEGKEELLQKQQDHILEEKKLIGLYIKLTGECC
jgi:hypothetical protein